MYTLHWLIDWLTDWLFDWWFHFSIDLSIVWGRIYAVSLVVQVHETMNIHEPIVSRATILVPLVGAWWLHRRSEHLRARMAHTWWSKLQVVLFICFIFLVVYARFCLFALYFFSWELHFWKVGRFKDTHGMLKAVTMACFNKQTYSQTSLNQYN